MFRSHHPVGIGAATLSLRLFRELRSRANGRVVARVFLQRLGGSADAGSPQARNAQ
jgi:hypothetical protein